MRTISRLFAGLLLIAAAVCAPAANATTIYFAGTEDVSFAITGGSWGGQRLSTNEYRTAFSRTTINCQSGCSSTADPPTSRAATPTFTATSTIWAHAQYANNSSNSSVSNSTLMRLLDAGTARIVVRGTGTAGQVKIDKRNAAGTFTTLVTTSAAAIPAVNGTQQLDLYVNYAVSGHVTLYLAGVSIADYAGDVTTDSATTLNQADFSSIGATGGTTDNAWSEIIITDTDSRSMAYWTLAPQAAGNTQSWTPNTVGNVNPTAINDANFVSTTTANALSEWTTPTSYPTGIWNVLAIVQAARVARAVTGPQNFEWLLRIAGTDYVTGSNAAAIAFGNFGPQIWAVNPNTSAAWGQQPSLSGLNLGIESLP